LLEAVVTAFVSPEYVYLLRLVEEAGPQLSVTPKAQMPTVLFPTAAPLELVWSAAVADPLTSPE
jgi:hypothetical protein